MVKVDYLVIGSGIAGLFSAIKLAEYNPGKKIVIVTKDEREKSNSYFAQGGISIVPNHDRTLIQSHIDDTYEAGDFHGKKEVIELVCHDAPDILRDLLDLKIEFDRDSKGEYDLNQEGGHTNPRILHYKDRTGKHLVDQLIQNVNTSENIVLWHNVRCIQLLVKGNECFGIQAHKMEKEKCFEIHSSATIMATGGIGQLFRFSTNSEISTGDGIALAYKAGAKIKDLEFIQFHPTSIYTRKTVTNQVPIITEAIRGKGAFLRNQKGEAFMKKYHADSDLAPRDVVSRAIITEMHYHNSEHVYLDCRSIDEKEFESAFPHVIETCASYGFDCLTELIPVVPAVHFSCGGIAVNRLGETTIKRLFASGECAYTGMHGANRLASNSLLEALVFGKICARTISGKYCNRSTQPAFFGDDRLELINTSDIKSMKIKIQTTMTKSFSVHCTTKGLLKGKETLSILSNQINLMNAIIKPSVEMLEIQNLILISELIIDSALKRKKNKGCFYNTSLIKNVLN